MIKPLTQEELLETLKFFPQMMEHDRTATVEFARSSSGRWAYYGLTGEIVSVWGLIQPNFISDRAYLWAIFSPEVRRQAVSFARASHDVFEVFKDRYALIYGHCAENNLSGQRWLAWLGAEFQPPTKGIVPFIIKGHA